MLGPVELRDAKIWVEVSPEVRSVSLQVGKKGSAQRRSIAYKGELGQDFNPVQFTVGGLDMNSTYEYRFLVNGKPVPQGGEFTTKDLWQWRKPAPDFRFLTGSCSYFNEPVFDRPGTPYGKDSSIFGTMAKEKAAFMLWLGDAWYTRDVDYYSDWGLWYRASHDRAAPSLQPFLKAMPQIATWDDHDYGPNDIGRNYILKETSRDIWKNTGVTPLMVRTAREFTPWLPGATRISLSPTTGGGAVRMIRKIPSTAFPTPKRNSWASNRWNG